MGYLNYIYRVYGSNVYRVLHIYVGWFCGWFVVSFVLYSGITNWELVARGRIELPTPCFSDMG
jgi:hypothetical protein